MRMNIFLFLFLLSCTSHPTHLEKQEQTVSFHYIAWACDCANWATAEDIYKYQDTDSLDQHCVFIEPADSSLTLPDTLGYNNDIIRFTGRYYVEKGFPKNYKTEQPVDKAKVFRYTGYKVIKSNYRESLTAGIDSAAYTIDKGPLTGKTKTLDVYYAAISCACPQWFETKNIDDTINGRQHFYLEPAHANLVLADTLFDGMHANLRISVTGRFYTKEGYPANYFPAKGDPEPAKVFRYEKLKVITRR